VLRHLLSVIYLSGQLKVFYIVEFLEFLGQDCGTGQSHCLRSRYFLTFI